MEEETLFHLLLNAPIAEREAILNHECENNPELRERLLKLLQNADSTHRTTVNQHDQQSCSVERLPTVTDSTAKQDRSTQQLLEGFGPPLMFGDLASLGPYRILKMLGKGGMGAVFAALDTRLDRHVALKIMLPDYAAMPLAKERFLREARAAARVKHEHIVTIYEADERNQIPYLAMEFLEGESLDQLLKRKINLTVVQAVSIGLQVAKGLQAAHRMNLIHRDIKPANIWLELPTGKAKILDFGLAKPLDDAAQLTKHGNIIGTPAYMSPEQARGLAVDCRSDLFSLGVLLYRMISGELPFPGANTVEVLMALATEEPKPLVSHVPTVPEAVATLIHQLLAKQVDARPVDTAAVIQRLQLACGDSQRTQQIIVPKEKEPLLTNQDSITMAVHKAASSKLQPPTKLALPIVFTLLTAGIVAGIFGIVKWVSSEVNQTSELSQQHIETIDGNVTKTIDDSSNEPQLEPKIPHNENEIARKLLAMGGELKTTLGNSLKKVQDVPLDPIAIQSVEMDQVAVTDDVLVCLAALLHLEHLSLNATEVTDQGVKALRKHPTLTTLKLGKTKITDEALADISTIAGLIELNLAETSITEVGLQHLLVAPLLTELHLGGCPKVTDRSLSIVKRLKQLTTLILDSTAISDDALDELVDLPELKYLSLYEVPITNKGLVAIGKMKKLTNLNLQRMQITDAGLASLQSLPQLGILSLSGNNIGDPGLGHLQKMTHLREIYLLDTNVTKNAVEKLFQELKFCKIVSPDGTLTPPELKMTRP